ncbi:MAG: NAD(P)/FAD-dependent oxidoreductase [Saprospiraceae bacterium]|nr:NAD(P)/FAD-dependent oxidoreductase [Saprospiraceae bacterium]
MHVISIGGGAASFFFAAELVSRRQDCHVTILEQGTEVLNKVRISGGGRCNVTHHCFDPAALIDHYPRGGEELLAPFTQFGPRETVAWFEQRGVQLKAEADGRMFPVTDSSTTIIDCLTRSCGGGKVKVCTRSKVVNIRPVRDGMGGFAVHLLKGTPVHADRLFVAPGGSKQIWQVLGHLGMRIVDPVPSLFTFQIRDERIAGLAGVSVPDVRLAVEGMDLESRGPLLITHRGMSGPAILKMSAWGARALQAVRYQCSLIIDFLPELDYSAIRNWRDEHAKRLLGNHQVTGLPKRLNTRLLECAGLDGTKKFATLSNREMDLLCETLKSARFTVHGQNRFKEEFVTAGGVDLEEINLASFGSRRFPRMYLAGEVLNIDGVTGGFNFQAAWTGAWLAAQSLGSEEQDVA